MLRKFAPIAVLMLSGLGCGVLLISLLLRAFPQLEPGGQRFIFTDYDGDTFRHQPGLVRPPADNRLLEDLTRYDDVDGFRRPARVADSYPIIAIGDSFTDGGQTPWTDVLAQTLDTPVRNLGWSGFGPLEYAEVMRRYGSGEHTWVLVMFFEGNDLSNIQTSSVAIAANGGVLPFDLTRTIGAPITDVRSLAQYSDITLDANDQYLYPLTHSRPDATPFEMAYISDYLWWLNGDAATYAQSRNIAQLGDVLTSIRAQAGEACVALVYAPTKEHIYFQYADPDGNRRYVLENALTLLPGTPNADDTDAWLTFSGLQPVAYDVLAGRIDHLRDSVRATAAAAGLQFIDLTPALLTASASGDLAYYTYDSHWSLRGHQVAGQTVADYLQATPCEPR
ncbi:MAG: hypothetical protein H7Y11_14640 [Armatimonadetes bacterium]|nr:hypothetical protein [Anaerolineae bacterium]